MPADPLQVKPDAQSVSAVHVVLQAAPAVSQANIPQPVAVAVQWPALQAEVVWVIASEQVGGAQVVPAG
jgi:hypothetical protein